MTKHAADAGMPETHLKARRSRILERLGRPAEPIGAGASPLPRERVDFLVREGKELYWNELAWEELTDEERVSGGHLTELVFPGVLSFVDALLAPGAPRGDSSGRIPHPEVVEEFLVFLADRYARATAALERGADSGNLVWARSLTAHLIDLILYKLYRVSPEEREAIEARA